jgi:hypothetical protein
MIYHVKLPNEIQAVMSSLRWCVDLFGATKDIEYTYGNDIAKDLRWWKRQDHVFFRNEQDYILYMLRWA